jgi:hypothetical protein
MRTTCPANLRSFSMKRMLRASSLVLVLLSCGGCLPDNYWSSVLGSSGTAIISTVLSEFFSRLFQQI